MVSPQIMFRLRFVFLLGFLVTSKVSCRSTVNQHVCQETCPGGRCFFPENTSMPECCHNECAGGCNGLTNADCFDCANFNASGKCVAHCPPPMIYDPTEFKMADNPDVLYGLGNECVKSCPSTFLIEEGNCVKQCSENFMEENDTNKCVHCPLEGCPKSPTCEFPAVINGIAIPERSMVNAGQIITVACNDGYFIDGISEQFTELQCLDSGMYDADLPHCVNGGEAGVGEFPWTVLIFFTRGQVCTGSIISNEWILTSGHCLLRKNWIHCGNMETGNECVPRGPDEVIAIVAGVHNQRFREQSWQVRNASEILVHPKLINHRHFIDFDIGLIRVSESFIYNDRVNRVRLPSDEFTDLLYNEDLYVSGWGKVSNKNGINHKVMQKIHVPYVDYSVCNSDLSYNGVITERMFCAGHQSGHKDACAGFGGGPLIYLSSNGTAVQGGIVSWGKGCTLPNFYTVYTNLTHFYTWLMDYVA